MEYNNEYNLDLYPKKLHWKEGDLTATRTTMWSGPGCHEGCQVIFYTDEDGKLVKVEGDPNSPFNQGRLCMRCLELPELVNHESRLKYPIKRVGERGEDKWERVSWDEAYDIICAHVREYQEKDGPESIISMIGTGRNVSQVIAHNQYANFGGPDLTLCFLSGDSCMLPRTALCYVVMGNQWVADMSQFREKRYEDDEDWVVPECIVLWGTNPVVCNSDAFLGHWIVEAMKRGSELISVDPQLTWIGSRAKYWLRLRPGTDAALALGMMNVIINEDLYDHEFVEKWCFGFEDLKERVQEYPVEKVAEICWVDADLIREAARFYAKAHPSTIQWGLAVDMSKIGTQTALAIADLAGITGNIDNPGGNILIDQAGGLEFGYNSGIEYLKEGMKEKRLGNSKYNLKKYGFTASSQSDCILEACETGKDENGNPRPVNMLWIQSSNPITNMGQDAPRIYRAMKNVPFICVVDMFKTPFATACADLILPCAMSNERDCVRVWFDPIRSLTKCGQFFEAKEDEQIMIDLGHRLAPELWPDWVQTPRDYMNWRMQTAPECRYDSMEELEEAYQHGQKYAPEAHSELGDYPGEVVGQRGNGGRRGGQRRRSYGCGKRPPKRYDEQRSPDVSHGLVHGLSGQRPRCFVVGHVAAVAALGHPRKHRLYHGILRVCRPAVAQGGRAGAHGIVRGDGLVQVRLLGKKRRVGGGVRVDGLDGAARSGGTGRARRGLSHRGRRLGCGRAGSEALATPRRYAREVGQGPWDRGRKRGREGHHHRAPGLRRPRGGHHRLRHLPAFMRVT